MRPTASRVATRAPAVPGARGAAFVRGLPARCRQRVGGAMPLPNARAAPITSFVSPSPPRQRPSARAPGRGTCAAPAPARSLGSGPGSARAAAATHSRTARLRNSIPERNRQNGYGLHVELPNDYEPPPRQYRPEGFNPLRLASGRMRNDSVWCAGCGRRPCRMRGEGDHPGSRRPVPSRFACWRPVRSSCGLRGRVRGL